LTKEEAYFQKLDPSAGVSLKLTVLNSEHCVWTMVAGGGASVVYSDDSLPLTDLPTNSPTRVNTPLRSNLRMCEDHWYVALFLGHRSYSELLTVDLVTHGKPYIMSIDILSIPSLLTTSLGSHSYLND